jgi:acetyltransferase-like isoleucine patch superfamily enzyme
MKEYPELKRRPLPNHKERGFFNQLTAQAREHLYSGTLFRTRFLFHRFFGYTFQVIARVIMHSGFRVKLQRARGVKIGKNTHIGPRVSIDEIYPEYAIIGEGVSLAGENLILTHNKPLKFHSNISEAFLAPTIIEDNVWIAMGVIVLPGVIIGEGSIVAAGAIVTRDIPPLVLAGGIPAKPIKDLAEKLKDQYTKEQYSELLKRRKKMGFDAIK